MPLISLAKKMEKKSRIYAVLILSTVFFIFYLTSNHLTAWGPFSVPLFNWEKAIPFLPWTTVIYLSTFLQVALVIILFTKRDFIRGWVGLMALILVHSLIFFLIPTAYPRPEFLPANTSGASAFLYNFLIAIDTPKNSFPSLHIAAAIFGSLVMWRKNIFTGIIFSFWTIFIIISTLTLKQHYFLDILGGAVTASVVFYFLFFKQIGYKSTNNLSRREQDPVLWDRFV